MPFLLNPNIPGGGSGGDKYKTTSTSSHTIISTGSLTFTVDTGLAYIPQQDVIIVHDSNNHMHGTITSYDEVTGVMVVEIQHKTGSGTYTSWTINLDAINTQATWGSITGTLADQTDLQSALDAKVNTADLTENVQDIIGSTIIESATIDPTYDDTTGEMELNVKDGSIGTDKIITSEFEELVQDQIGTKVKAGANVTVTYNDTTGETTVASTSSGATPAGSSGNIQFNDGANNLGADSNLQWDNVKKRLGVQVANPLAVIHNASIVGDTLPNPTAFTATLVEETALPAPTSASASIIYDIGTPVNTTATYSADPNNSSGFLGDGQDVTVTIWKSQTVDGNLKYSFSPFTSSTFQLPTGQTDYYFIDVGCTDSSDSYIYHVYVYNPNSSTIEQDAWISTTSTTEQNTNGNWSNSGFPGPATMGDGYQADGLQRFYEAYSNDGTRFSIANVSYSVTPDSSNNYYYVVHTVATASTYYKILLTDGTTPLLGTPLLGFSPVYEIPATMGGGTVVTPNVNGYLSDGTILNRTYRVKGNGLVAGQNIYSVGYLQASVTDPNDGKYYRVNLAGSCVSPTSFAKIFLNLNGAGYNSATTVSPAVPTFGLSDNPQIFWGGNTVDTPNSVTPVTQRIDRNSVAKTDPANLRIVATGSGVRYPKISFGVANDSADNGSDQTHIFAESSTGYMSISAGRLQIVPSVGSDSSAEFGNSNVINKQQSATIHFQVKGSQYQNVFQTRADMNLAAFGHVSTDPSANVWISPHTSQKSGLVFDGSIPSQEMWSVKNGGTRKGFMDYRGWLAVGSVPSVQAPFHVGTEGTKQMRIEQASPDYGFDGEFAHDQTKYALGFRSKGTVGIIPVKIWEGISDRTITGTTVTSLIPPTVSGQLAIGATFLAVRNRMVIEMQGRYTTAATLNNITIIFKTSTGNLSSQVITLPASQTDKAWRLRGVCVIRTIGSSGTVQFQGEFEYDDASLGQKRVNFVTSSVNTINTTIPQTFDVTAQWTNTGKTIVTQIASLTSFN